MGANKKEDGRRTIGTAAVLSVIAMTSAVSACDAGGVDPWAEAVSVDTVQGIVVTVNREQAGLRPVAEWALHEEWAIGGVDATGPAAFGQVRSVSLGPNGQAYVLDGHSNEVLVFDHEAEFVRSLGGRGDGPGEFQVPLTLAWDSDYRLWIPDLIGRYTVLDSVGNVLETFSRPLGSVLRIGTAGAFDDTGAFVDEMAWNSSEGSPALQLFRVRTGGQVVDTSPPIHGPPFDLRDRTAQPTGEGVRAMPEAVRDLEELRPQLVYAITNEGAWTSSSVELRLIQHASSGDTVRIVETSHRDGIAIGTDDRRGIDETLRRAGLDPSDFEYGQQIVGAIFAHPDGHLLVKIEGEGGEQGAVLDVFDPIGRFLGTMRTTLKIDPRVPPSFQDDVVLLVTRDALDVQSVVRARLER